MVSFQIMSDLHIETMQEDHLDIKEYITPKADILILAGDIGRIYRFTQLKNFITDLSKEFKLILYVLGNQEYYTCPGIKEKTMEELFKDIQSLEKEIPNLHILSKNAVILNDKICVIGCTLWSDVQVGLPKFIVRIPDMTVEKYRQIHHSDLKYIKEMILYCKEHDMTLVVITHHTPTYLMQNGKPKFTSLYCTNLEYLLQEKLINTWICGHIHKNYDFYTKDGTRVVTNQKGKYHDKIEDFSKEKIIEISINKNGAS